MAKADKAVVTAQGKQARPIRVKALALGFYDNLRRQPGTVFTIKHEREFSKRWMTKLITKPAPAVEVEATADETETNAAEESVI